MGRNRAQPPNHPPPLPQQPPQPTIMPVDQIPDDVAQWTTQMLRVLGWNSKKLEHGTLNVEIGQMLQGHGNQPSPLITDLAQKHRELSDAYTLNGVWDSTQEMLANEIKATLTFESMPNQRPALQTGSANPTFWLHGAPDPITQETREYIFKPAMKGGLMAGMPPGGEPAREALAGRVAEQLRVFSGLDFNMPTTNVITVDRTRLGDFVERPGSGNEMMPGERLSGSLQQFKPSDGDLRRNFCAEKGNITAQSCQNVAMLDTVMLNLDRHDGNLLLGKNGSGLIPIDHGLSFPSTETVRQDQLITNMAGEKNVLLRLPGSYEPFTQESLAGLAELDPDLMTSALMAENLKMAQAHPGTEGTVSTESLTISNLSTKFLKKAAPTLPPAVLQIALSVNSRKLLDPAFGRDAQAWDLFAGTVIAEYAPKVAPLKEFWMLPGDEREAIFRKLNDDGILDNFRPNYAWVVQNIELVLPYCQAGITPRPPRPTPPRPQPVDATQTRLEIAQAVPGLKLDRKKEDEWVADWQRIRVLGGVPVVQQALLQPNAPKKYKSVAEVLAQVRLYVADVDKNERATKLLAIHQVFPNLILPEAPKEVTKLFASWDAFLRNGGARALRQAQQLRPNLPPPRDLDAALLMILAPPANPAQAALKGLDYLDRLVVADPAVVSQQDQTSIQQMRIDITGNQLQGDPKAAVTQLTDRVLAAAVPLVKARFEALERRMPENLWEQIETLWFTSLLSGKLMDAIAYLQQLEATLPAQPIR